MSCICFVGLGNLTMGCKTLARNSYSNKAFHGHFLMDEKCLCLCNDRIKHKITGKFQGCIPGAYLMWSSNYGVDLQLIELTLLSNKGLNCLPN